MACPVSVITGFLGSGKSTLLNRILQHPAMAETAVIINEFGEVSIDHLLVQSSIENTQVLQNGCICCTIRGDLVDTLMDLEALGKRGEIPAFRRVIVETTGLADITSILQTLLFDRAISGRYEAGPIVTTVDASNILFQLPRFPEAERQIALASTIALTKGDLVDERTIAEVRATIARLNPAAPLVGVAHGEMDPAAFLESSRPEAESLRKWLSADDYGKPPETHNHDHSDDHDHDHTHHHAPSRHADDIQSICITRDEPLNPARFKRWLCSIVSLRGNALLRVKGVVNIAGISQPVVIQGVRHVLYPPLKLDDWPDDDRRSRIVFITQGISLEGLKASQEYLAG
jgi:G3E family GTPase